ncbi:MAG: class II aldolase/adducin family protein [Phycisphaeraceae bacterium]
MTPTVNEWAIRQQICDIGKRIWQKSFCAGNEGNHSVKVADNRYLCTPTGISKGFLEPEDVIVCDAEGQQIEPNARGRKPTSEIKVHLAIYKVRSDVGAVIHSHPPHATAFAIAGIPLPEAVHPEAEVFLGKVRTAQFAMPSTHDLPQSLLPLIGPETNSLLMGNHGSVSFSTDIIDAYYKLEILDAYCRVLLLVHQLGRINLLDQDQMKGLLEVKKRFGLEDERLACAEQGCIGADNSEFLALFNERPATAVASRNGGACECAAPAPNGSPYPMDEQRFENMVQTITDQIMASAG